MDETTLERKSMALGCRRIEGRHTHQNIARVVDDIHRQWNIEAEKVIASVTDSASNMVKMFEKYGITEDEMDGKCWKIFSHIILSTRHEILKSIGQQYFKL